MGDLNYTYAYPHPAVTADCVIFGYDRGGVEDTTCGARYRPL